MGQAIADRTQSVSNSAGRLKSMSQSMDSGFASASQKDASSLVTASVTKDNVIIGGTPGKSSSLTVLGGIKSKAGSNILNGPMALIRRQSGRTIKRTSKELSPSTMQQYKRPKNDKLSKRMQFCSELLGELFSNKFTKYAHPFYLPVDAAVFGLTDYHDIIKRPMDLGTIRVG